MRLAWFSPMPPVRTGIAAVSAELVSALAGEHLIDVYTDSCLPRRSRGEGGGVGESGAHDFVWRHGHWPYDLIVYQIGNSSHHDYIWPYLFRYPGLTVLHDAHLHHARAAMLLRTGRAPDYRAEFAANHPGQNPDLAELAVAGFDNHLYYSWPMTRLVIEASKMTAVHTPVLAGALQEAHPAARIVSVRLAHGRPVTPEHGRGARMRVRDDHGIPPDAIVFGVFGGLTPEKRIEQMLDAVNAILPYAPSAHLLLAGAAAEHFDVATAVRDRRLDSRVTIAGYILDDEALLDHIAACDVSVNLRWPTARELSGPWLRALAAGLPTITTDLAHLADVPSLDPRTWTVRAGSGMRDQGSAASSVTTAPVSRITRPVSTDPASRIPHPVTIAVDILDEDHSLRLAMRRLATDPELRASLGTSGRAYWEREHSMPLMVQDYRRVIDDAVLIPAPRPTLPAHLVTDGGATLRTLLAPFGVESDNVFLG